VFAFFSLGEFTHAFKKYNYGALEIDYKICKTNTVPKTAMRGPGHAQGSFLAEAVVEAVAARLGLHPELVRERNFHDFSSLTKYFGEDVAGKPEGFTLPSIWSRLKASVNWEEREREVEKFNETSTWRKRGIAMIPIVYNNPSVPKNAMVSIFADGSIALETSGVEIDKGCIRKFDKRPALHLTSCFRRCVFLL